MPSRTKRKRAHHPTLMASAHARLQVPRWGYLFGGVQASTHARLLRSPASLPMAGGGVSDTRQQHGERANPTNWSVRASRSRRLLRKCSMPVVFHGHTFIVRCCGLLRHRRCCRVGPQQGLAFAVAVHSIARPSLAPSRRHVILPVMLISRCQTLSNRFVGSNHT